MNEVARTRRFAELASVAVGLAVAIAWTVAEPRPVSPWLPWLGAWGLVFPAIGWRYYRWRHETASTARWGRTVREVFGAGAVTALAAAAALAWTRAPALLTGAVGYAIVAGALWPNATRADRFARREAVADPVEDESGVGDA